MFRGWDGLKQFAEPCGEIFFAHGPHEFIFVTVGRKECDLLHHRRVAWNPSRWTGGTSGAVCEEWML